MATATEENYLKAMFQLAKAHGEVNMSTLSSYLEVSKPTANSMVKNLKEQGLIAYEKYKPLLLTPAGEKAAALVLRKHRLTEMFLVEKMGFGWDEVHEIAEQIEHISAPEFFDRMDELMDFPNVDPHGSPIPDKEGNIVERNYQCLNECQPGMKVKLSALRQSSKALLEFLDSRGLYLGLILEVASVTPFDGSIVVEYAQNKESLSAQVCERLLVEVVG